MSKKRLTVEIAPELVSLPPEVEIEADTRLHLKLVGPMEVGQSVLTWLYENGYRTNRSGPYTDREMHPTVDITRFLFIAEKPVGITPAGEQGGEPAASIAITSPPYFEDDQECGYCQRPIGEPHKSFCRQ